MGRVLTNNTTLAYGLQGDIGDTIVVGDDWFLLEPNTIADFGATLTTVPRSPISKNRQRRKGVTTDLDSAAGFDGDLTISHFNDFIQAFMFAISTLSQTSRIPTNITTGVITFPAITNGDEDFFLGTGTVTSLVHGRGFSNAANNTLFELDAASSTTDITATGAGLVDETPPTNAQIELAGARPATTSDLSIVVTPAVPGVSGATAVLTSASDITDFSVLGLTVGQFIHIGGETSATQFTTCIGYARVRIIGTDTLTLDKLDSTVVNDTGSGDDVDLLFGRFTRNVPVDDATYYKEQYIMFEMTFPGLDNPTADMYQYSRDNLANTMAFNLPLSDKATITFAFIGTDTDDPVDTQKTGAVTPITPNQTGAFSTTADIARLQATTVFEDDLSTDFKSLTITLNNNVSAEKVIGNLGARFMNTGNFEVDLQSQLLFTNADVVTAIRNNDAVTMDWRLSNADGVIYTDIPNMTFGDGSREFPVNETVLINITGEAYGDDSSPFTYSAGVSQFPVGPST